VDYSAQLPKTLIILQRPGLRGSVTASPADRTRRGGLSQDPESLLDSSFQALAPPAMSPEARPIWGTGVANYPSWVPAWHERRAPVHALGCYVVQGGTWHFPGMLETGRGNYATEDDVLVRYVRDMWEAGQFPVHPARRAETEDPMILVFDRGYTTYGHFLVDILPRLLIAEQTLGSAFADCSIFVPADVPAWAELALAAVGFNASRLCRFDWHTNSLAVAIAIVPTLAHAYYSFHPRAVEIFREIRRRAAPESDGGSRRLFLSRRGQHSNRRLLNRVRIEEVARHAGLEVVTPETLSFREQIALYGESSLMVGEYGSALHNSIFMPRGSGVVALNPLQYLQSWLGALNEENTMYVYPEGADGLTEFVEFVIDEDRFARALEFAVFDGSA
jgi:glycosyl transferase family 61